MHIINECIHQFNKNTNMYFYSKLVKVNKFNTKEIFNQLFHIYSVQKNNMSDDNTIYIINEEQKQYLPLKLFCSLKNVNCDYEAYKLIILNNKKLKNTNIGLKYLDILEYLTNLLSYNVQIFKSLQKLIKISIQKNFNLKNDYISDIFISQQQKNIIYITTSLFRFLNIGPTGKEALVDLSNKYNLKKYFKDDLLLYVTFFLINHFSIKMNLLNDEIRYSKNLSELKIKDDDKKLIDHVYNCYSEVLPDRKIYENIFLESVLEWYNNNLKYRDGIIGNNIGILCIILTDLIYQIQKKQYIKYEDTQNEII